MGILDRILRAGEGKKLKALQALVPDINALEPALQKLTDDAARGQDGRVPRAHRATARPRRPARRGVRGHARGRDPRHRSAPLRRAADGWRRAALRLGRRDEDRRGQDPRSARCPPTSTVSAARACTSSRSTTTWPASTAEWMGRIHRWLGLDVGLIIPGLQGVARREARPSTRATSRTAPTTSSASTTCATTWPATLGRQGPARSQLRDRRRGRLDPHRRGAHAADHQRPRRRRRQAVLPLRHASSARCSATSTTRSKRTSGSSCRSRRASRRSRQALGIDNLYDEVQQNLVHQLSVALKAKELYKRDKDYIIAERRGEDRRRVHRPHPRGSALERGHPPGRRGQGGRQDQGGEPDARHDHAAELLPHVRQARRHDRHGPDRGRRADEHLRARRGADPDQQAGGPRRPGRPDLQERGRQVRAPSSTTSPSSTRTGQPVLVGTDQRREERVPVAPAEQARHPARGAQRQAAHP